MTRVEVVVLVLSVLAALWAVKRLSIIIRRTILAYVRKKRMCETCFLEDSMTVPADYECSMPDEESFFICKDHIKKLVPDQEKLAWFWDKGYVKKA